MKPLPRARARRSAPWLLLPFFLACSAGGGQEPPRGPDPERVQIGYGSEDPRSVTASVSSITAEEVEEQRSRTMVDILQRVPGLTVVRRGEADFTVRIRGPQSFRADDEPLLVIDGVAVARGSGSSPLAAIHPSDVARIDVLKDAAAAIYGSRGGNGVIVVTTKR